MKLSRRGIFGFLAFIPVAAKADMTIDSAKQERTRRIKEIETNVQKAPDSYWGDYNTQKEYHRLVSEALADGGVF